MNNNNNKNNKKQISIVKILKNASIKNGLYCSNH